MRCALPTITMEDAMTRPHPAARNAKQRRRWLACVGLVVSVWVSAGACAGESMTDPLLGIDYDTAAVHFTTWTPPPTLAEQRVPRTNWLYAQVVHDLCTYSIVSGLIPNDTDAVDGRVGATEPDFGVVIRQCGDVATELGVPDNLFEPDAPVDDALATALLHDAVPRYIKAWRGKARFQAALESLQRPELMQPVLAKALIQQGLGFHPTTAHGDVWAVDFYLPLTLTLCNDASASPASGFFVVAREHACRRSKAVLTFTAQREDFLPTAVAKRDSCRHPTPELVEGDPPWSLCADDGDPLLAIHRLSCGADSTYFMQVHVPRAQRKRQASLLQNLIHHIRPRCPEIRS